MVLDPEKCPGVKAIAGSLNQRGGARVGVARWMLPMLNGQNSIKEIGDSLHNEGGFYGSPNSAEVSAKLIVDSLNEASLSTYGAPLFTKPGRIGGYYPNPNLLPVYIAFQRALLPIDLSAVEPEHLFDDEVLKSCEELGEDWCGYIEFVAQASTARSIIEITDRSGEMVDAGDLENIYLPTKSLAKKVSSLIGLDLPHGAKVNAEHKLKLGLKAEDVKATNAMVGQLCGGELLAIHRKDNGTKELYDYFVNKVTLDRLVSFGLEVPNLPDIKVDIDAYRDYQQAVDDCNKYISGKSSEVGFIYSLGIGTTVMLMSLLEQFRHDHPAVAARSYQALRITYEHLAAWGVTSKVQKARLGFVGKITAQGASLKRPDNGRCLGVETELFYPERGESTREAKNVCKGCSVRDECLEVALVNGEKFGIWGGLSERERRRLRKKRRLALVALRQEVDNSVNPSEDKELSA